MKKNPLYFRIFFILLLSIGLFLLPFLIDNPYILDITITVLLFAFLGNAWNLVGGYCGQASLGHAAYFGLGAYVSTILFLKFGISPWIGMMVGAIITGGLAIVLGYPSLRMKGPYFVFFTLGFAEAIRILFFTWEWIGGSRGVIIPLQDNPAHFSFFHKVYYYYIILGFLIIGMLFTYLITRSKMGKYFVAVREDEMMAEALGIHTALYKTFAFAISASLMAIGGTFYAQYILFIHPNDLMSVEKSVIFMLIVVAGGKGTLFGPLVGSAVLIPLWEYFRAAFGGRFAGLGIIFAGLIILIIGTSVPHGLIGVLKRIHARWSTAKRVSTVNTAKKG